MRSALFILVLGLLPFAVRAQSAADRLDRWATEQQTALSGVRAITMVERGHHMFEGASGPRRMEMTTRYTLDGSPAPPEREVLDLVVNGKPMGRPDPDRRRRHENPVMESMQQSVDLLLQPERLLPLMEPPDEVETAEFNGREYVSIRTQAKDLEAGPVRAVWWLDPDDGRLVQVRVFVENPEGGAFDVLVRYERVQGIDVPVRRRVEGSFPWQRRMRTFTILVDVRTELSEHEIVRR